MMQCMVTRKVFSEYRYEKVCWSGDSLPVCPKCGASPYDKDFETNHARLVVNEVKNEPIRTI